MKAKTMRLTVLCPFCQTPHTFKSQEKADQHDGSKPLHNACKKAVKEMMSRPPLNHITKH